MRVDRYDSLSQYTDAVETQRWNFTGDYGHGSKRSEWDAGVGYREAIRRTREGDPSLVGQYADKVDRMVSEFKMHDEQRAAYVPSVAGSRVVVPEYLGGSPMCMRRRQKRDIQTRSVNIYVNTTCHAVVPADNMLKRGASILALLEFLQMSQVSVELYLTAELGAAREHDYIQVIHVESHPLDLSQAAFAIAHPAFARQITYAMASAKVGFTGSFPYSWDGGDRSRQWGRGEAGTYEPKLRAAVGMQPQDIYIPMPGMWTSEIMDSPETWLENRIRTLRGNEEVA